MDTAQRVSTFPQPTWRGRGEETRSEDQIGGLVMPGYGSTREQVRSRGMVEMKAERERFFLRTTRDISQALADLEAVELRTDVSGGSLVRREFGFTEIVGDVHQLAGYPERFSVFVGDLFG